MKIVYGVCGEGNGHGVRSKSIIKHLQKYHIVNVFAGDKAFPILVNHCKNISKVKSFRIIYRKNKVSDLLSLLYNFLCLPLHVFFYIRVFFKVIKFKPSVIITDFDYLTQWSAILLSIPVISVDNQQFIRTKIEVPLFKRWSYMKSRLILSLLSPRISKALIPTFSVKPKKKENQIYVCPSVKEEISKVKNKDKGFFFVYQTSDSNKELLCTLKKIPHTFVVNGFHRQGQEDNCIFRIFDEKQFVEDIGSCKAIITNGGFTLITEALALGKPIISIPIKGQFEQELNSYYLEKEEFGMNIEKLTPEIFEVFLHNIQRYKKALQRYKQESKKMPTLLEAVDKELTNFE